MKKILIADDSEFMRGVLKEILAEKFDGHEVIEAATEKETVAQFKKERPCLTLLDIIMPEMEEGIGALKQIKEYDSKANIVMISAVGLSATMDKCKKLGVTDYIVKPFDDNEVVKVLKKYL